VNRRALILVVLAALFVTAGWIEPGKHKADPSSLGS